jgi:hypothetical protein
MTKRERHAAFRRALKAKGLNCTQIARYWGLNPITVRLWHCGTAAVPPARLAQLEKLTPANVLAYTPSTVKG